MPIFDDSDEGLEAVIGADGSVSFQASDTSTTTETSMQPPPPAFPPPPFPDTTTTSSSSTPLPGANPPPATSPTASQPSTFPWWPLLLGLAAVGASMYLDKNGMQLFGFEEADDRDEINEPPPGVIDADYEVLEGNVVVTPETSPEVLR